jgi:hypothetical protein
MSCEIVTVAGTARSIRRAEPITVMRQTSAVVVVVTR